MPELPRDVTAWVLAAEFGTGGLFEAKMKGGRVVWTDARLNPSEDTVILGRVGPVQDRLRVLEQRVDPDTILTLLSGTTTDEDNARIDAEAAAEDARQTARDAARACVCESPQVAPHWSCPQHGDRAR